MYNIIGLEFLNGNTREFGWFVSSKQWKFNTKYKEKKNKTITFSFQ